MTNEERLLLTIQKLLSQSHEDPDDIKSLCLAAIEQYGIDKYEDGYGAGTQAVWASEGST